MTEEIKTMYDNWPGRFWGMSGWLKLTTAGPEIGGSTTRNIFWLKHGSHDYELEIDGPIWQYKGGDSVVQWRQWLNACGIEGRPCWYSESGEKCSICQGSLEYENGVLEMGGDTYPHIQCAILQKLREAKAEILGETTKQDRPTSPSPTSAAKPERWPERYFVEVPPGAIPYPQKDTERYHGAADGIRREDVLVQHEEAFVRNLQDTMLEWPYCNKHEQAAVMKWDRDISAMKSSGRFHCLKCKA